MSTTSDWGLPVAPATADLLAAYRRELLRWNRQINLLSRRDPEGTATALIRQCAEAFAQWWAASGEALAGGGPLGGGAVGAVGAAGAAAAGDVRGGATAGPALQVFDLGSGGGLPAFVWLALLAERGVASRATLVEPRHKRAWFLERLRQLPGAPAYDVEAAPWGPGAAPVAGIGGATAGRPVDAGADEAAETPPILFTIKALRLSEAEVLGGLAGRVAAAGRAGECGPPDSPAAGRIIEIVRFQPGAGVGAEGLARDLAIPAPGGLTATAGVAFRAQDLRFLEPAARGAAATAAAGLLVSRHRVAGGVDGSHTA